MSVRKAVLILISVVALSGCATKTFTEQDYDYWGYHWQVIPYCNNKSMITTELAATGDHIIKRRLATAQYDKDTFYASAKKHSRVRVDEQICRGIETNIRGWQLEMNRQKQDGRETQQALENVKNSMPKQTYCNKIGNQVFCNTY